ncbi:MAG: U32 family peptidase [Anaerovoracaceae bacterium]|nr:U32 family peptidase [Anaerovoracaceae bacterium]
MEKKLELLAPAGDLEKLKVAVDYGADAVYCGGEAFGLRAGAKNFSPEQLAEGVGYAHKRGRKVHLTLNIFAHNEDIKPLRNYLREIRSIPLDAFIVSDPGVVALIKEERPDAELHLSTQANTTNYLSARFWHGQGVKRVVLARELSLKEIQELRRQTPDSLELESFVHGAMCISYSGRCLLSNYMIGRDANHGECAHPCRWKYSVVEEQRPGEYFPVREDERGTYIFNSKDLCMIGYIPELAAAGLTSLKIEGRVKSAFYVAAVVGAYRQAIDAYERDPEHWTFQEKWLRELTKVSHRQFTTGFYFGKPDSAAQNYETSQYCRDYTFLGIVRSYDPETGVAEVEQRNKMSKGDRVEIFGPGGVCFEQELREMRDKDGISITEAPHAQQIIQIPVERPVFPNFMLRKGKDVVR